MEVEIRGLQRLGVVQPIECKGLVLKRMQDHVTGNLPLLAAGRLVQQSLVLLLLTFSTSTQAVSSAVSSSSFP